jgi:hypothetical protein
LGRSARLFKINLLSCIQLGCAFRKARSSAICAKLPPSFETITI